MRLCLLKLCIFFPQVHDIDWIQVPIAAKPPNVHLPMLNNLIEYKGTDKDISSFATKKMISHSWYQSEKLIGFTFFDDHISADTKNQMVKAMNSYKRDEEPLKRVSFALDGSRKNLTIICIERYLFFIHKVAYSR